jgi:hypothetical protein
LRRKRPKGASGLRGKSGHRSVGGFEPRWMAHDDDAWHRKSLDFRYEEGDFKFEIGDLRFQI